MNLQSPTKSSEKDRVTQKRVQAIDVTRGMLMIFIIIIHANATLGDNAIRTVMHGGINHFLRIGTPGFTMVSGLLLGYFTITRSDMSYILRKYTFRGMTLLLTTHVLIAAALYLPYTTGSDLSFGQFLVNRWYITDSLAIIFIFIAPLAVKDQPVVRLASGILLLFVSQLLYVTFMPNSRLLLVVKELLVGVTASHHALEATYPLLPLTGMFLIGFSIGSRFGTAYEQNTLPEFERSLRLLLVPLMVLSLSLVGLWACLKWGMLGFSWQLAQDMLYPSRNFSMFPAYLAFLMLIFWYWVVRLEIRACESVWVKPLGLLGQTSLFTYVVQYYVVQTTPYLLGEWKALSVTGYLALLGFGLPLIYGLSLLWRQRQQSISGEATYDRVDVPRRAVNAFTKQEVKSTIANDKVKCSQ